MQIVGSRLSGGLPLGRVQQQEAAYRRRPISEALTTFTIDEQAVQESVSQGVGGGGGFQMDNSAGGEAVAPMGAMMDEMGGFDMKTILIAAGVIAGVYLAKKKGVF